MPATSDQDHWLLFRQPMQIAGSLSGDVVIRFNDGILIDDESWMTVTPENIAQHIAKRILSRFDDGHILILDGFCGVGGNLIQFACSSPYVRVIGCDIDQERLRMAKHNAGIYGVAHQCEFIHGDFMDVVQALGHRRIDVVFLSPPWGGVEYLKIKRYSLDHMTPNGCDLINLCRGHLTDNIAMLAPRNLDISDVRTRTVNMKYPVMEYEKNMVSNKIKTITLYYGALVDESSETDTDEL